MTIHVIVTFQAKQDKLAAFTQIMQRVKQDLPKVAGCAGVRIFNDRNEPHTFTLIESWHSENQHKAHIDKLIESGAWEHIAAHIAADPISSYFQEI